jgi:hypothetical protein
LPEKAYSLVKALLPVREYPRMLDRLSNSACTAANSSLLIISGWEFST